jgi:hypothetical protein
MTDRLLLVGDNPFHGVSHFSSERSLLRAANILDAQFASELVVTSINHGANGFTFTASETTLSILRKISDSNLSHKIALYLLVPNVNELVRTAGSTGGLPGLAKDMVRKMSTVLDFQLLGNGIRGAIYIDPKSLLKAYLKYEYLRLQKIIKKRQSLFLASLILHETITDMALALDMPWVFQAHIELMHNLQIKPGFETRNLPYFVKRFKEWQINFKGIVIEAPFNAAGFQMCPSRAECEKAISDAAPGEIIAFSILAAGYLKLPQALDYIHGLSGINGIAVGVSSKKQAIETFSLARDVLLYGNQTTGLN